MSLRSIRSQSFLGLTNFKIACGEMPKVKTERSDLPLAYREIQPLAFKRSAAAPSLGQDQPCFSGMDAEPVGHSRLFPMSPLRLIRALAVEIHEDRIGAHRYLKVEILREQRKQLQPLEAETKSGSNRSHLFCPSGTGSGRPQAPCISQKR